MVQRFDAGLTDIRLKTSSALRLTSAGSEDIDSSSDREGRFSETARDRNSSAAWNQSSSDDPSGQPLACQSS
jgi:hypothetical protein